MDIRSEHKEQFIIQASEEIDDFIFTFIKPYCEKVVEQKISKYTLEIALKECMQNHPQLFSATTTGYKKDTQEKE